MAEFLERRGGMCVLVLVLVLVVRVLLDVKSVDAVNARRCTCTARDIVVLVASGRSQRRTTESRRKGEG